MKTKQRTISLFLSIFILASGLHAQNVTRINPRHISLRGVSLSSLWCGMMVGDSNYVAITHDASRQPSDSTFWAAVQGPFDPSTMLDAVAYAGDTLHAVVAGASGSLAWTSDDGASWTKVALGTSATVRAVTWNKSTTSPLLVGVGDGGLIICSTDLGVTWRTFTAPASVQLNAVTFGTANDAVAVCNDTTLFQTHDGGQTWSPMAFPYDFHTWYGGAFENKMGAINFSGVAMNGADSVYVCFDSAMIPLLVDRGMAIDTSQAFYYGLFTGNGGNLPVVLPNLYGSGTSDTVYPNFTSVQYIGMPNLNFAGGTHTLETYTTAIGEIEFVTSENDSAMGTYFYGGLGDADGNPELVTLRLRASAFWKQDSNLVILMVGDNCSFYRHIGFPSITRRFPPFPGRSTSVEFVAINTLANGVGYDVGVNQHFQKTTDSGRIWRDIILPIGTQNADSNLDNIYTLDSATAIVVGWNGIILRYDLTGFHFLPSGTQERLESIAFPSQDTGTIVGDFGTVLQSSDRGETWPIVRSTPTTQRLYSVAFNNDLIGIATGDSAAILRTSDEGQSWNTVNNLLTGTAVSIRHVQAFPNGTFLAQAGNYLLRSTDFGLNWQTVNLPSDISDTSGMSFYSPQIGMIAGRSTSSKEFPDTAHMAYTTNAGSSWTSFAIPFWNFRRIMINWLNDHEALVYGSYGFIDDVTISTSGVHLTRIDNASQIQVFPNPTTGDFRVDYTTKASGPVQIELWDETGKKLKTLFQGEEAGGAHEQHFTISKALTGAFFIRLSSGGAT